MKKKLDNTALWNESAKAGALLGCVSVGCLVLKELANHSGVAFLQTAAYIVLWSVEFFVCILVMKDVMLSLRSHYDNVKMADTFRLGRRAALFSGLLLASAQALFIMRMPEADYTALLDSMSAMIPAGASGKEELESMMDRLPVITFISQWLYCYLYGTVLASLMSRYIFLQKLFGGEFPFRNDNNTPDEQ